MRRLATVALSLILLVGLTTASSRGPRAAAVDHGPDAPSDLPAGCTAQTHPGTDHEAAEFHHPDRLRLRRGSRGAG